MAYLRILFLAGNSAETATALALRGFSSPELRARPADLDRTTHVIHKCERPTNTSDVRHRGVAISSLSPLVILSPHIRCRTC